MRAILNASNEEIRLIATADQVENWTEVLAGAIAEMGIALIAS